MVLMVMELVMMMAMVWIVLSQVGWLHQRHCQSINVKASTSLSLLLAKAFTQSEFNLPKETSGNASPAEARLSQALL
jgi:hypothetical protein